MIRSWSLGVEGEADDFFGGFLCHGEALPGAGEVGFAEAVAVLGANRIL